METVEERKLKYFGRTARKSVSLEKDITLCTSLCTCRNQWRRVLVMNYSRISLRFHCLFPDGPGLASTRMHVSILDLLELRMMEMVMTIGAIKTCKAPVKSASPTNQHPVFYRPDALPVARPTVSEH